MSSFSHPVLLLLPAIPPKVHPHSVAPRPAKVVFPTKDWRRAHSQHQPLQVKLAQLTTRSNCLELMGGALVVMGGALVVRGGALVVRGGALVVRGGALVVKYTV